MPSYSQEQITPVADARLVDKIKFSAKVALLKQQPNAPQGDERQDFKTAVYLCACLNNFSFEDALTSSNSSILSFMMTTFYQGFKGEGAPVKSIQDYMDVLQELVNDGALEHLGPGLGFVCPSFKIEATGKISAHFMTNDYGTELHFENGVYNTLVFSKYVLIPGDEVKVVINGLTNIATVIEITKMRTMLVGEYGRKKPSSYKFDYEAPRFLIHERGFETMKFEFTKDSLPHQAGNLLVVEIVKRNSNSKLTVRVREIVKDLGSLQTYIVRAVLEHSIPNAWPAAIANNVSKIPQEVTAAEIKGREDLRQLPLVTIDGDDAKDFDDAVYCEKQGSKFHLYVAIADVSYYVRKNTALDSEAMVRCNSVYFPYYVIPMLPVELSNGICSLNPNVDRLCMVCDMVISKQGKIEKYQFYPAVMNSHARLTYSEAHYMLESGKALFPEHEQCVPWVKTLHELYLVLKQAREQRGAFEFEGTEVNFIFDEKWKVIGLEPETRNDAHMLIEECMIAANICAATFVRENKYDTLYRVHARPSEMKLDKLRSILSRYGIDLHGQNEPSPQDFKRVSQEVAKLDEGVRNVIGLQLLRSMSKATYHPENIGHFGLALENYAHFTSPIRRYPDLQLHRVIKFILEKQKKRTWGDIGAQAYSKEALLTLGLSCTDHEVSADDAEFDVDNSLKCEYVKNFIGAVVPATVSTVASNAVFVTLNDFYIDGRLDWVDFTDADQQYFEIFNKKIHVGDQILVRIMNVNPEMRHIELSFSNGARAKDLNMADSVSAKLKTRKPLPPDSAYNNSYKDELFQRISDFSRGKSPNDDSMAVRNLADFGLAQKLTPDEGAQPASKKQSKMSQQMSEIKQQLLGSLQSAKATDDKPQAEDVVDTVADNTTQTLSSKDESVEQNTEVAKSYTTAKRKSSKTAAAKSDALTTKSGKDSKKKSSTPEPAAVEKPAEQGTNQPESADAAHKSTTTQTKTENGKSKTASVKSEDATKSVKSKSGKAKAEKAEKSEKATKTEKSEKTGNAKKSAKSKATKDEQSTTSALESAATTASKSGKESDTLVEATDPLSLLDSNDPNESKIPVKIDVSDQINRKVTMQVKDQLSHTVAQTGNQLHISESDIASFVERAPFGTQVAQNLPATQAAQSEVSPTLVKVKRKGQTVNKTVLNGQDVETKSTQTVPSSQQTQTEKSAKTEKSTKSAKSAKTAPDSQMSTAQTASAPSAQTSAQEAEVKTPETQVKASGKTKAKAKDAAASAKDKAKAKDISGAVKEQTKAKEAATDSKTSKPAKSKATKTEAAKSAKTETVTEQTQDAEQFKSLNSLVAALAEDAPTLVEVPGAEAKAAKAAERAKNRAVKAKTTAAKAKSVKTADKNNESAPAAQNAASSDSQVAPQVEAKTKTKASAKAEPMAEYKSTLATDTKRAPKSKAATKKEAKSQEQQEVKPVAKTKEQSKAEKTKTDAVKTKVASATQLPTASADDKVVDVPAQKTKRVATKTGSTKSTAAQSNSVKPAAKTAKAKTKSDSYKADSDSVAVSAKPVSKTSKTKSDSANTKSDANAANDANNAMLAKTKAGATKSAAKAKSKTASSASTESSANVPAESASTQSVPAKTAAKATKTKTKAEAKAQTDASNTAAKAAKAKSDAKPAEVSVRAQADTPAPVANKAKAVAKTKVASTVSSASSAKATDQADAAQTKAEKSTAKKQSTKRTASASAQKTGKTASAVKKAAADNVANSTADSATAAGAKAKAKSTTTKSSSTKASGTKAATKTKSAKTAEKAKK